MTAIIILALIGFIAWFWFDSVGAKEVAMQSAALACQNIQVQLLDSTVALKNMKLTKDRKGQTKIRRTYNFEFTRNREDRLKGKIVLTGKTIDDIFLFDNDGTTVL